MYQRILSSVVAIAILMLVVFSSPEIIALCAVVLSMLCLYEAFHIFSYHKVPIFVILGSLTSFIMPFLDKFDNKYTAPGIFMCIFVLSCSLIIMNKTIKITDIAMVSFLIFLIPFSFSHIIFLRNLDFGKFYIWFPFIGAFCTDTGAFFIGRAIGGKKLCESLSPKKTISGSIGGFVGSVVGFTIYLLIMKLYFKIDINYVNYYLIAILCGAVAQIGDLTASALKREKNVKDFGKIMPGHGGIMDRVDSLMFVAPTIYFIIGVLNLTVLY